MCGKIGSSVSRRRPRQCSRHTPCAVRELRHTACAYYNLFKLFLSARLPCSIAQLLSRPELAEQQVAHGQQAGSLRVGR